MLSKGSQKDLLKHEAVDEFAVREKASQSSRVVKTYGDNDLCQLNFDRFC